MHWELLLPNFVFATCAKLREYVDDTEDYINIMLDEKQNQLLQMGVMLSTATVVTTAGVVVVGLFGMNIGIDLYNAPYRKFWETTLGTIIGCVILYVLAIGFGKKSGLLQWQQQGYVSVCNREGPQQSQSWMMFPRKFSPLKWSTAKALFFLIHDTPSSTWVLLPWQSYTYFALTLWLTQFWQPI